ncbi:MAG: cysteine--tRNA ligase [Bacteroidota bacterium]
MNLRLYNSLTKSEDILAPLKDNTVRIYSCGPTVYNYAHIGNMRAFLFPDLLQRVLKTVGGHNVDWVMNITDIDDKTIHDSAKESKAWREEMGAQSEEPRENLKKLTTFYTDEFLKDLNAVGIIRKDFKNIPLATDYIPQMQELITRIFEKEIAYISDGSVYFNVDKWRKIDTYGRLFKIDFENFREGVRIDADEYERGDVRDFVLWKARKEGEPFWDFTIDGQNLPGRPGWHIECSAMARELLGLPFDIHTGGVDLRFPHHEDEIAQSKAGYGVDVAQFWCHNEFLEVEGEKMSKSKGNFFTLRDLIEKNIDPIDIRFAMMSAHYGSVYNFTFAGIEAARKAKVRIQEYIYALHEISEESFKNTDVNALREKVFKNLADDLHTPKALEEVFIFMNANLAIDFSADSKKELLEFFKELNDIFAVWEITPRSVIKVEIPDIVLKLADERWLAKKERRFADSDRLRDEVLKAGFVIKDTKDSFKIEKA